MRLAGCLDIWPQMTQHKALVSPGDKETGKAQFDRNEQFCRRRRRKLLLIANRFELNQTKTKS